MYRDDVTIWQTDAELDSVYEMLRREHVKKDHRYASNYHKSHIQELTAKSIYWDENGEPMIVSSILQRPSWPKGVYRILNRAWKPFMNIESPFTIHRGWFFMVRKQADWCFERKAEGVFISRQTVNVATQRWGLEKGKRLLGYNFEIPPDKYLTCVNEDNPACWQRIVYCGDTNLLQQWKRKKDE